MSRYRVFLAAAIVLLALPAFAQVRAKPAHVALRCYDAATGNMNTTNTSIADYTSGTAEFCAPWHDDEGDLYPVGEPATCTVTFFDLTQEVLPDVEVGKIGSYSLPKDGAAPVEMTCDVSGLTSPIARRTAQHPPFLRPVAPELLD